MRDSRALSIRLAARAPPLAAPVDEPKLLLADLLLHGEQGASPSRLVRALCFFLRALVRASFRLGLPFAESPPARPQQPSLLVPPALVPPLQAGSPPSSGPRRRRARRARASSSRAGQPPAPPHPRASPSRVAPPPAHP